MSLYAPAKPRRTPQPRPPAKAFQAPGGPLLRRLQSVQVSYKVLDLLIGEHILETLHLAAAQANDVGNPLIVRRQAARRKIGFLKHMLQAWPMTFPRGIGGMAAVAILVIEVASGPLPRVEAELGVRPSSFDFAPACARKQGQGAQNQDLRSRKNRQNPSQDGFVFIGRPSAPPDGSMVSESATRQLP